MMTSTYTIPARALRLLSALLTATLAIILVSVPAPAQAAETDSRLTIHKMEAPLYNPLTCPADGKVLPSDCTGDAAPVAGVGFTLTLIPGTDPATAEGQQAIAGYQADLTRAATAATGESHTGLTGGDGTLAFDGLPTGLYYLAETSTPINVTPSLPALILLPAPRGRWEHESRCSYLPEELRRLHPHRRTRFRGDFGRGPGSCWRCSPSQPALSNPVVCARAHYRRPQR